MPKLSIWNSGQKSNNYKFLDRTISEYFTIGGTALYVHKYLGIKDNTQDDGVAKGGETKIQDVLFLENRDRAYAKDIIEMRGIYSVQDSEFDLKQFGLFLDNDTIFIEIHMNDMISVIGRKLMSGDVIELPHLRDDALLDPDSPAINKFYSIEDSMRASDGYSQTWYPHIWRIKCKPLTNSQEYNDILDQTTNDPFGLPTDNVLRDVLSGITRKDDGTTQQIDQAISDAVVAEAREYVSRRYFDTTNFYVVPGAELGMQFPWIFAGDGEPPNGAVPIGAGTTFPIDAQEGDYFLRTDYDPKVLYQKKNGWIRIELDYRTEDWSMASRLLEGFINNRNITTFDDGRQANEKTPLSKAIKPKTDF